MIGPRSATRGRRVAASFSDAFIFTVGGGPAAPGQARQQLDLRLRGRFSDATLECARLLVSELVTNCVIHAGIGPGDSIEVSGTFLASGLRVEVGCAGRSFEHEPARPAADDPHGRGLYLVEALSTDWGMAAAPSRAAVWFELAGDAGSATR